MIQLCNRLKELREVKGLSFEELATNIGLDKSTIWAYESGQIYVPVKHLERLANFFEVSVDSLLDRCNLTHNLNLQNISLLNDYNLVLDDKPRHEN